MMAYPTYQYPGYQPTPVYYPSPVPDQLAQLRQNQMPQQKRTWWPQGIRSRCGTARTR